MLSVNNGTELASKQHGGILSATRSITHQSKHLRNYRHMQNHIVQTSREALDFEIRLFNKM